MKIRNIPREAILALVIIALCGVIAARFPNFIRPTNLLSVATDTAPLIMLALGQFAVILTRCIDLSVAANLALTGMICALLNMAMPGFPMVLMLALALVVGALLGAVNGVLVWKVGIPPIVVTLGTMTVFRGIIFLISGGSWVNAHEMSDSFTQFPRSPFLGIELLAWIAAIAVTGVYLLVTRTPLGRAFYAVGGNPHAAVYTGIDVGRTQFLAFVLSGALAGMTGYLWVARYAVAYVEIANGFELDVVAACVIGGVAIAGGSGTVVGVVLGALFLGVIKNALPVVNISPFWQLAISGAAIIIAVALNARSNRPKGRIILKKAEHSHEPV
jgi:rhamnose transport system permease protein